MKKDLKRYSFNKQLSHAKYPRWQWIVVIAMSVFIAAIVVIAVLHYPLQKTVSSFIPGPIASYAEEIRSWMIERKAHFHKKMETVKQVALRRVDSNPPIQFEFYTALPNMHIPVPEPVKTVSSAMPKSTSKIKKTIAVFDAERLQREFKQELTQNSKIKER